MDIRESLIQVALIGSDRMAIDSGIYTYVNEWLGDQEQSNEQIILNALAIYNQLRQVNPKIAAFDGEMPGNVETPTVCPAQFTVFLQEIIETGAFLALPEFLQFLQSKHWAIPPEYLPWLFDYCLKDKAFFRLIKPIFGKNAKWLMVQNTDWQLLDTDIALTKWSQLLPAQKRFVIKQLANEKPDEALLFIQKQWKEASLPEQEILLTDIPSVSASIPLLEQALSSSRKKIRTIAATRLVTIQGSKEQDFLASFLPDLLQKNGQTYSWELPDSYLEASKDLNLPLEVEKDIHLSMKGAWMGGLIACLPPSVWEDKLDESPQKLIPILLNSSYHNEIFWGLVKASITYQNDQWRAALIMYLWENRAFSFSKKPSQTLLSNLSEACFQQVALKMAKTHKQLPSDGLLYQLLKYNDWPWTAALSRLLLHHFKSNLENSSYNDLSRLGAYKLVLKKGAYLVALDSIDAIMEQWPEQSPSWVYWEARVYRFTQILKKRKSLMGQPSTNVTTQEGAF